jgi:hypothetical protein
LKLAFLGSIGKALGKVLGGAITGFLGSGFNPIGAIAGGIGGLLAGGSSGGGSVSFQSYISPYAQQGANILNELLKQTPQFAENVANIKRPHINMAITSFETAPSEIRNIFGGVKSEVKNLFDNLLAQQQSIIQSEQAKQNLKLGALGLLNTQAQQWTLADLLNKTAFEVLKDKTEALANLTGSETQAFLQHLFAKPSFYSAIADNLLQTDQQFIEWQTKLGIANALMGVPTAVQPFYQKGLLDYLPAFAEVGKIIAGLSKNKNDDTSKRLFGG